MKIRFCQKGPKWTEWTVIDRNGPNGPKCDRTGQEWTEVD